MGSNGEDSPFRERGAITDELALEALARGDVEILGRMPWSSNATFLVDIDHEGLLLQAIYKPAQGERPLWDFPEGLYSREAAAYDLSAALGWDLVPPTIVRDGPLGDGSLQLFVPCDFEQHYFHILEDERHHHTLQRLCAFDVVANSTDRKGGHCLLDRQDHVWAIDNGLTFHTEFKLRTVIWDWSGEDLPGDIRDDLCRLLEMGVPEPLAEVLDVFERDAMVTRTRSLVENGRFPSDPTGRRYPWPLV